MINVRTMFTDGPRAIDKLRSISSQLMTDNISPDELRNLSTDTRIIAERLMVMADEYETSARRP